jgi:1,4-alpha-glucan branching enzyme
MNKIGKFTFVLHSHLPYVLHYGKWPHGMDWLNEAACETYIPILNALNELVAEGYSPKLTIGLSPVLTEQLASPYFKEAFRSYLQDKVEYAQKDQAYFTKTGDNHCLHLAKFWENFYSSIKSDFEDKYHQDIVYGFKKLSDEGYLDIITCGVTHGYFPLLYRDESIQAQVKAAVVTHEKHYGKRPKGIWLPECAYRPSYKWQAPICGSTQLDVYLRKGVEEFLAENGIEYFFVDSALTMGGKTQGVYHQRYEALQPLLVQQEYFNPERQIDFEKSPYEIYLVESTKNPLKKPVAIFTRDPETGLQVWSGDHGYPGDGLYLDFHKKHFMSGLRYWRVTGPKVDLAEKQEYDTFPTEKQVELHAHHFSSLIYDILDIYNQKTGKVGILTAPFDTELFGHWWFEGVNFLKNVLKNILRTGQIELTNASEALESLKPTKVINIPEGSWGEGGHHYIWLNDNTDWTWKHIYDDENRIHEVANKYADSTDPELNKILKQAARELLFLQASDWQFLISTVSAKEYSANRFVGHHNLFNKLLDLADQYYRNKNLSDGPKPRSSGQIERRRIPMYGGNRY